ncbi:MAG: hypothetical protein KAR08_03290, partial [Candidatus Heimdallarchaeota archaeon]|nr:hypothetical protein [Candidatus Heimdallarchaeota archaeon]
PIQKQLHVNAEEPLPYVELGGWNENLGELNQIIVNGAIAFITDHSENLFVYDLENLSNPLLLNTYRSEALPSYINDILYINESLIVLGKGSHGLEIIDCSNFSNIISVYTYTQTDQITSLAFKDSILYATDKVDGLHIFDLSDLNDVQYITNMSSAGSAYSIRILDQYAYIASSSAGIKIFDLIDPINPIEVGNFIDGSSFLELEIEDNFVYTIDDLDTLKILNVSDISNPVKLGEFIGSHYDDLVVLNDIAFVSASAWGFSIMNCTNPNTIVEMVKNDSRIRDIFVDSNYIYLTTSTRGVELLSIDSLPSVQPEFRFGYGDIKEILIENNIAYLANGIGGVVIVNISDSQAPEKLGVFNEGGKTYGLYYNNDLLYVANDGLGLQILDVKKPTHPTKLGAFYDGGNARSVAVRGNRAYLADSSDGFEIINITNLESPFEIVQGEDVPFINESFTKIEIMDDYAYLLDKNEGVFIFSIGEEIDDTTGEFLGDYSAPVSRDFAVKNDRVYMSSFGSISIIDVSIPENPLLVSDHEGYYENQFLEEDVLFATYSFDIYLFNITNPNQLNEIGSFALSDSITDLFYEKGVLYLSHYSSANDLQIITFDSDL